MNGYDSNIICRQNQDLKENIITISRKRSQRILMYELNKQLFDIPHELYTFFNLRQVNYARNRISCIPADIGRLMQLREINLAGNQIESLPNEITNLINLIYIDLRKNHITQLPNDIGNLVNLIHILLDNNDLEEIPPSINNIRGLQRLSINNNNLKFLPDMSNLSSLSWLHAKNNNIKTLPETFGHNMTNMKWMNLSNNNITSISPDLFNMYLVEILELNHNQIELLHDNINNLSSIQKLTLYSNNIKQIPTSIILLDTLLEINISKNFIQTLPKFNDNLINLNASNNQIEEVNGFSSSLTGVNLTDNSLLRLPSDIIQCKDLQFITINKNKLSYLPLELWMLTKLKIYNFADNPLFIGFVIPWWLLGMNWKISFKNFVELGTLTIAILLLLAGLLNNIVSDKQLFGYIMTPFIAIFLTFLGVCSTYIGYKSNISYTIQQIIRINLINLGAYISLCVEFVQLSSFAFIPDWDWPYKTKGMFNSTTFDIPQTFTIIVYIMTGLAFFLRIALEAPRFISWIYDKYNIVNRINITEILSFTSSVMYLSILTRLMNVFNCTYNDGNNIYLDADPTIMCWSMQHYIYVIPYILALILYYPSAVIGEPIWQQRNEYRRDIRYKPNYLYIIIQLKFLLVAVASFFSISRYQIIFVVMYILISFALLATNIIMKPSLPSINTIKNLIYTGSCVSSLCSAWISTLTYYSVAPFVTLVSCWGCLALYGIYKIFS